MSILNAAGLGVQQPMNQQLPAEGPKAIQLILDFSTAASFDLDLSQQQKEGFFSMLQTLFIDTSLAPGATTITINGTGQVIKPTHSAQGYYNVLAPNPVKMSIANASGADLVKIQLINVPVPGHVWGL